MSKRNGGKWQGSTDPYKGVAVKGIHSFANIPDSAFNVFRCTGCGGEDVSMWAKQGVQHWAGPQRVCGTYELLRPFVKDPR